MNTCPISIVSLERCVTGGSRDIVEHGFAVVVITICRFFDSKLTALCRMDALLAWSWWWPWSLLVIHCLTTWTGIWHHEKTKMIIRNNSCICVWNIHGTTLWYLSLRANIGNRIKLISILCLYDSMLANDRMVCVRCLRGKIRGKNRSKEDK